MFRYYWDILVEMFGPIFEYISLNVESTRVCGSHEPSISHNVKYCGTNISVNISKRWYFQL